MRIDSFEWILQEIISKLIYFNKLILWDYCYTITKSINKSKLKFYFREQDELQKLFKIAKGLIKPNKAINSVRVCVEAITLLSTHSDLFSVELLKESKSIITR